MFIIKKADETMTTDWQETADEIIKGLFLEDNEAVVGDRLLSRRKCIVIHKIKRHIDSLKPRKAPGPDGIKAEIYQKTSDITAPLLIQIIND